MFSSPNYEYDIEIPANSPQFASNWQEKLTWSTMNVNTWMNDIDNYDTDTGAYYTQVQATRSDGKTYISEAEEGKANKDYHWYTIDWRVEYTSTGEIDPEKSYIAVYFDDPFIPADSSGYNVKNRTIQGMKDSDGNPYTFPTAPSGAPVHATRRFISAVAARLTIGPWFGWWGYGLHNDNGNVPNFDVAKVRMAHLNICPQVKGGAGSADPAAISLPQTYDQGNIHCDFRQLYDSSSMPIPTWTEESPKAKGKAPSSHQGSDADWTKTHWWGFVLIAVVGVVVVGVAVTALFRLKKGNANHNVPSPAPYVQMTQQR